MFGNQTIAINWGRSGARAAAAVGSAVILLAILYHGAARADDQALLRDVLEAAAGHDEAGWAFTRTLSLRIDAAGELEKINVVEKFDPSKRPGEQRERMEIHEEDGKITTEYDDDIDFDIDRAVYANLAELEFENAELVSDNEEEAVYRLSLEDGEEFSFGGARFEGNSLMDNVFAELVIRKSGLAAPYVSEVRVRNSDSSGGLFFDIEKLDMRYHFAPSPDGTTYLSQGLDLELELEVLIFIDIYVELSSEYSDFSYVGEFGS